MTLRERNQTHKVTVCESTQTEYPEQINQSPRAQNIQNRQPTETASSRVVARTKGRVLNGYGIFFGGAKHSLELDTGGCGPET